MPVNLSKAQILNFLQCPRRFWLDQYHPENEGDVTEMDASLDAEEAASLAGREMFHGEHIVRINGRLGLRNAIEQTGKSLTPGNVILDATFEHEGISARVDVLDLKNEARRAILITAAAEVAPPLLEDCALQMWVHRGLGLPDCRYFIATLNGNQAQEREKPEDFSQRFTLNDVTADAQQLLRRLDSAVPEAREMHASLAEPPAQTGDHCHKPGYVCPFMDYCEQR